jgi:hypothetical protein
MVEGTNFSNQLIGCSFLNLGYPWQNAMSGTLEGKAIVAAAFDFGFMGGSMGSVVGEKFVRGINKSLEAGAPFIVFTASGL